MSFDRHGGNLYQFLLNPANVRFRMTRESPRARRLEYLGARHHTDDAGWKAETPAMVPADARRLQARLNLIVVTHLPIRDKQAVQLGTQREKTSWAPLRSNFHEPEQFGALHGIQDTEFKAPFLPFIHSAAVQPYHLENGRYFYNIALTAQSLSSRTGMISLTVTDQPEGAPPVETARGIPPPGDGNKHPAVPADTLVKRTATVRLVDPRNGEEWQRIIVTRPVCSTCLPATLTATLHHGRRRAVIAALPCRRRDSGHVPGCKNADGQTLAEAGNRARNIPWRFHCRDSPWASRRWRWSRRAADGHPPGTPTGQRAPGPAANGKPTAKTRVARQRPAIAPVWFLSWLTSRPMTNGRCGTSAAMASRRFTSGGDRRQRVCN